MEQPLPQGLGLVVRLMPGIRWKKALRKPKVDEALRRKGYSKGRAARISNAQQPVKKRGYA